MTAEEEAEAQAVFSRIKELAAAHFDGQIVTGLRGLTHPAFATRANDILGELAQAALRHEYVASLEAALSQGKKAAQSLLIEAATQTQPPPAPAPKAQPSPGERVIYQAERAQIKAGDALRLLDEIKGKLADHPDAIVDIVVSVRETR
jgi:hypothetical protein